MLDFKAIWFIRHLFVTWQYRYEGRALLLPTSATGRVSRAGRFLLIALAVKVGSITFLVTVGAERRAVVRPLIILEDHSLFVDPR